MSKTEKAVLREPNAEEAAAIADARKRVRARGPRLALQKSLDPDGTNSVHLSAPHSDDEGYYYQLLDTFGSSTSDFPTSQVGHILQVAAAGREGKPHPQVVNGMLAAISGIAPQNETEAMLAVQMVATHDLAMNLLAKAKGADCLPGAEGNTTMAVKLLRTFTAQTEALAKLRRGGEQKVTVEHVHVYPGGQAIVGNVTTTGQGGGLLQNGQQAHAPIVGPAALALSDGAPLLCQDTERDGVPIARSEGQSPVSDARRRQGKRCP